MGICEVHEMSLTLNCYQAKLGTVSENKYGIKSIMRNLQSKKVCKCTTLASLHNIKATNETHMVNSISHRDRETQALFRNSTHKIIILDHVSKKQ